MNNSCILEKNLENSLEDYFCIRYNIPRQLKIKPCETATSCINFLHIKFSKIDMELLEQYLIPYEKCLLWLGTINGNRPFYSNNDLRRIIYCKHGEIPKGFKISIDCNNIRCLNFDHMYLVEKIENIKKSKLDFRTANIIRQQYPTEGSYNICKKYNITRQNLSLILNNKIWVNEDG